LAYFQGSVVVEHLISLYGEAGLRRLLVEYGKGLDTDAALKSALDTDFDKLQTSFDAAVEKRFGALRQALAIPADVKDPSEMPIDEVRKIADAHPGSFPVQMAFGRALLRDKKTDEAIGVFERAATLVPMPVGKDSPHALIATIALQKNDRERAMTELQAL